MSAPYRVPARPHRVEDVVSRSRFVTTLERAATPDEARAVAERIGREFPDATHHCWAFVTGPPGSTTHIGLSDAGEPKGTAGRPMLTVLLHSGVGEIVAVSSRWFGGTKLGTGGLARAYAAGVRHALETLPTELKVVRACFEVTASYGDVAALRRLFDELDARVVSEQYGEAAVWVVAVPQASAADLRGRAAERTAARAELRPVDCDGPGSRP